MDRIRRVWQHSPGRVLAAGLLVSTLVGMGGLSFTRGPSTTHAATVCQLNSPGNAIQHVIYLQFDNLHFTRDNPNVPSDLEQMPSLLNFIKSNGTLFTNDHTPLIAHTGTDILTTQTGLYGDRHGQPISNSYRYFNPDGSSTSAGTFAYWTDPADGYPNMVNEMLANTPAPWVPFTRAGCNFGAAGAANVVLENTGADISTVFGPNSPQAVEARNNPNQASADYVGIGIHCAKGDPLCTAANGGVPDLLPAEPQGYVGYSALFGNAFVAPRLTTNSLMTDLDGTIIKSPTGNIGFPGFAYMTPSITLSYVAAMQEHGVPITYTYLTNAHNVTGDVGAYGPGQAGYEANLKADDHAFATFFTRLANDGITPANTLFVISSDEGDHFVGGAPSPAGCDGVTVPCTYSKIGEINVNLAGQLATQFGVTTPFKVHADSAPVVYIDGNPGPTSTTVLSFTQALGSVTALNPITGQTDRVTKYLASPAEMRLLHMITADPNRTPTVTMFADPNYFLFAGAPNCSQACVTQPPAFAWNHGDVSQEINTTWVGFVGPGVQANGIDAITWSDHTDIRPTIMYLLGLRDDYQHDGRVLYEDLSAASRQSGSALPPEASPSSPFQQVVQVYKQINSSVGDLALTTLQADTMALEAGDPSMESTLASIAATRDTLVSQIRAYLEAEEFLGQAITTGQARSLVRQAQLLEARAHALLGQTGGLISPPQRSEGLQAL